MQTFISVDWGTSFLKIRIVDAGELIPLGEVTSPMGILAVFNLWQQSGRPETERLSFYKKILLDEIYKTKDKINFQLQNLPIIISGMASANIGMKNLPYTEIPFNTGGDDVNIEIIRATDDCPHSILLVPGVKTNDDVMRGEETQLIGSIDATGKEEQLFIFPGTHSKHVIVKNGKAVGFKTYMTGEFFELLAKKSILSNSVEKAGDLSDEKNLESFETGIGDSLNKNLLNNSFHVRTNELFKKLTKQENYCYLSGLLLGAELKELNRDTPCTIICDEIIYEFYKAALRKLKIVTVKYTNTGNAVMKGHYILFNLYKTKLV